MFWCCCQGEEQYVEAIWTRPWFSSQATAGVVFPASSNPDRIEGYPLPPPPIGFARGTSVEARTAAGSAAIPAAADVRLSFRGYTTEGVSGSNLVLKAYAYDYAVALPTMSPVVSWTVPRYWQPSPGVVQTSPNLAPSVQWLITNGHVAPLAENRKFCFLFTSDTNLFVSLPSPPWVTFSHWISDLWLLLP